jgi:hypothetical protein
MEQAAIKGSAILSLIEDVGLCVEQGRVSAEELEVRLEPEDVALLGEKVSPARWYPIEQYRRLTDLLFELTAQGRDFETFLKTRGAAAAERLIQAGIYQQLDYSTAREQESPEQARSDVRLRVSLIAVIVNRGSAHVEPDPERPGHTRIDLRAVAELPDCLGHTIAGFIEHCARARGTGGRWHMARVGADLMRFTYEPDER